MSSNEIIIEDKNNLKAIWYCDGSAAPNPGFTGYGIHGYVFTEAGTRFGPKNANCTQVGYLDKMTFKARQASFIKEHMSANKVTDKVAVKELTNSTTLEKDEMPVKVEAEKFIDIYHIGEGTGTNNTAEADAITRTLQYQIDNNIKDSIIYSDSMTAINMVKSISENMTTWKQQIGLSMMETREKLHKVLEKVKANEIKFEIRKIKGHAGLLGNELSDRLAFLGRYKASINENQGSTVIKETDPKNYWNPTLSKHPMINGKQIFFTTNYAEKDPIYFSMNYKDEVTIGKTTNECRYTVAILKEKLTMIEYIKDTFSKRLPDINKVATIRLDVLNKVDNYKDVVLHDTDALIPAKRRGEALSILGKDKMILVNEIFPQGRATTALDNKDVLMDKLESYRKYIDGEKTPDLLDFVDITDFMTDDKGKMKDKLGTFTYENDMFNGLKYKINLLYNYDILAKNDINALLKAKGKVVLMVERFNNKSIRYYTVIDTKEDVCINCNFYSNIIYQ